MHLITDDLTATYANILIVLLLTFAVDQRFGTYKNTRHRQQAVRWYRAIVTVDAFILSALILGLEQGAYALIGYVAQLAMAMSVMFLAGSYLGLTQRFVERQGRHESR
ncbi:hypothetical protein [Arthrobacter sp. NPDC092385]|uniref:hypothetical protein n=1 Tax=Arthrobacter sp. NPDC092385 TaxID=3363943 RepID=UPI003813A194